jgi:hypothetical protein
LKGAEAGRNGSGNLLLTIKQLNDKHYYGGDSLKALKKQDNSGHEDTTNKYVSTESHIAR